MTPEDEAFNEIERRSKVKQTLVVHTSKEAMLLAKIADYEALIRDLTDALRAQKTWVGLTDEERRSIWSADQMTQEEWDELFDTVEAKLKEKNNG